MAGATNIKAAAEGAGGDASAQATRIHRQKMVSSGGSENTRKARRVVLERYIANPRIESHCCQAGAYRPAPDDPGAGRRAGRGRLLDQSGVGDTRTCRRQGRRNACLSIPASRETRWHSVGGGEEDASWEEESTRPTAVTQIERMQRLQVQAQGPPGGLHFDAPARARTAARSSVTLSLSLGGRHRQTARAARLSAASTGGQHETHSTPCLPLFTTTPSRRPAHAHVVCSRR